MTLVLLLVFFSKTWSRINENIEIYCQGLLSSTSTFCLPSQTLSKWDIREADYYTYFRAKTISVTFSRQIKFQKTPIIVGYPMN